MKKLIVFIACAFAAVSCQDFFTRTPYNEFAANEFFASEDDLKMYTNGLINTAMPSVTSITMGEDLYTDFCATKASKATSSYYKKEFYHPGLASGWSASNWSFLRRVAYMLDNMENAKEAVTPDKYNHYEGVARFFRAFATFNKVKTFGDCFFIDHVVSPSDTAMLYSERQSREYVMHKVIEDLKFACDNCLTSGAGVVSDSRVYVNKYVALAFASRVFLYEGTYRKYHEVNPSTAQPWTNEYETSAELLQMAFDYSEQLINSNAFKLVNNYASLFTSKVLPKDEVIWGKTVDEALGVAHSTTYSYVTPSSSQGYSPTKDYVRMFLKTNGKPASGAVSITKEFENRDKRMSVVVLAPGQKKTNAAGASVDFTPNFMASRTGYQWMKWVTPEHVALTMSNSQSLNSIPIFRYAEVLLNYAEAAEELGRMDEAIWEKTIGALRKRAGVASIYPGSASFEPDVILRDYYTRGVLHLVSPSDMMLEIRRERATELMLEGDGRFDDLMRWRLGDLISRRYDGTAWRGIYFTADEALNGFSFNGKKYTVSKTKATGEYNYQIGEPVQSGFSLSEGDHGYLVYTYEVWWDDKMYTKPIPTSALNVNPKLGQNAGWQWQ